MAADIMNQLLIKIFVLTLFGLVVRKLGIITDAVQKGLGQLLIKAILPVTIIMSSQNTYTKELAGNMGIVFLLVTGYYIFALVFSTLCSKKLKTGQKSKNVFITMITFANVGFIGFPIASELYGAEGVLYTVIYNMVYQLLFYTYGAALLSGDKKNCKPSVIFRTPVTLSSFLCVVLFLVQIKLPDMIAAPLNTIGGLTTPISLILIGCSLGDAKIRELIMDRYSYLVSLIRMLVLPALMIVVLLLLHLPPVLSGTCTVLTALPAGSMNVIYAQDYDCDPGFASRTVIQTMVIMIVTLPIMIVLSAQIF